MIIYLVDSPFCKIAYTEAERAASVAIRELEKGVKHKRKAKRQIFSDHDGLHFLYVQRFDEAAVAAYIKAMKVYRKVILDIEDPVDDTHDEITIHKILLETEEGTLCRKIFQDVKPSLALTDSHS